MGWAANILHIVILQAPLSSVFLVGHCGLTGCWRLLCLCVLSRYPVSRRNDWNESRLWDYSYSTKLECDLLPSGHGFLPHALWAGGGYPVQTCPWAPRDHPADLVGETAGEPRGKPRLACHPSTPALAQHMLPVSPQRLNLTLKGFSPKPLAAREWPICLFLPFSRNKKMFLISDTYVQPIKNLNLKISDSQLQLHNRMTWKAF